MNASLYERELMLMFAEVCDELERLEGVGPEDEQDLQDRFAAASEEYARLWPLVVALKSGSVA